MRRCLGHAVAVVMLFGGGHALEAQSNASPSALAAFNAIVVTPIGALPQVLLTQRTRDSSGRGAVALRYGRYTVSSALGTFSNLGATGMLKIGRRSVISGTIGTHNCDLCNGLKMGGLDLYRSIYDKAASGDIGGDTDIGIQLSAGYGKDNGSDVRGRSLAVATPIAVSLLQPEGSLLTIFASPALAQGILTRNGTSEGEVRFMISAGIAFNFRFGLGVHAAMHRIAIADSPTQFGFAMSWRFGATRTDG